MSINVLISLTKELAVFVKSTQALCVCVCVCRSVMAPSFGAPLLHTQDICSYIHTFLSIVHTCIFDILRCFATMA